MQGVKSNILQAISDKGVTVPDGSALADCPELIGLIPTGGGISDFFENVESVIPNNANYNIIDLGQTYDVDEVTYKLSFYERFDVPDTNGNFAGIAGIDNAIWIELLGHSGANNMRFRINGSTYLPYMNPIQKGLYNFELNKTSCVLNGVNYNITAATNGVRYVRIGCTDTGGNYRLPAIKEIILYVNNVEKSHLIPVKRLTDNKVGLFDIVRGLFDEQHSYTSYSP